MRYQSILSVSLLYHSLSVWATNYSWNTDTSGNWNVNTNWSPATGFPSSSADTAAFNGGVITLPITVTVNASGEATNQLLFSSLSQPFIINNSGASVLSLGGGAATQNILNTSNNIVTVSVPLLLSGNILIEQASAFNLTLSGGISDGGHGFGIQLAGGTGTVILQGTNSYTGVTDIEAGTLQAGGTNTLAPLSNFTVNATLDLNNFANTIHSLAGAGTVTTGTTTDAGILSITNGGTFSGAITGLGGLTLTGGTLSLTTTTSANTYTGTTTINSGATLQAGAANAFASASDFIVNGTLALNNFPNAIESLSGTSGTATVTTGGTSGILTITNSSGTFPGAITGSGGLTLTGGTLDLTGSNNYSGPTMIEGGTSVLEAGSTTALSSNSIFTLATGAQLNLFTFSNTIAGLNGDDTTFVNIGSGATLTVSPSGGDYEGIIQGLGGLTLNSSGNTLFLSNANTYTGATTITAGTLALTTLGEISSSNAVSVAGTFDISGISASSTTINLLSGGGTGVVTLGARELIVNTASATPTTFAGTIQGGGGSLSTQGDGSLTLSGTSSYTGSTIIQSGSTLIAGSTTALAPLSTFTVDGTLNLQTFSNTINSLSGDGSVEVATPGVLTVSDGGNFSGIISGTGGSLALTGGTLDLSNVNTYTGPTTITAGTLELSGPGSIAASSAVSVSGTFDISNINYSPANINALSGSGTIELGDNALTVNTTGTTTFSGGIQGMDGSLTIAGTGVGTKTLILGTTGDSTYTGSTTINSGATLQAGAMDAFASASDFIVNGTLALNNFPNAIESLSGTSGTATVTTGGTSGILTITNSSGTFPGAITGSGGLTLTGGTLDLTGSNNYSGPTMIEGGTSVLEAGSTTALSSNSIFTLATGAQLNLFTFSNTIAGLNGDDTTFVNIGSGATLTVSPSGGDYEGIIQGLGGLTLNSSGNTLFLSNANTYTGATTITAGTLALTTLGEISSSNAVSVAGTFDISGISASSTTINLLSGSGTGVVTLGARELIVNTASATPTTFAGTIQGGGGSLSTQGDGSLTLSGTSSYTGSTIIQSGSTLIAGSTTALAPLSTFTVDGTLNLQTFSNTVNSLFGDGSVEVATPGVLTVSDGGNFSGIISGTGGSLALTGGTLDLSNVNTYTGPTTITAGTLELSGPGSIAASSAVSVSGTFDISNINYSPANINALSGSGTIELGDKELTVNTTGTTTFSGGIQGMDGSLTIAGTGTLILGTTDASSYTGNTTINSGATLQAGAIDAFASASDFIVNGTLALNNFPNTIESLSGTSGTAMVTTGGTSGILTITNSSGTFPGAITETGGLTLTGGTLDLTGSNNYSGPTMIEGGTSVLEAGSTTALSSNSIFTLATGGQLNLFTFSNTIAGLNGDDTTFVNIGSGATLTVSPNGGDFEGIIQGAGGLTLNSSGNTLILSGPNTYTGATTITAGTLALTGLGEIPLSSSVSVAGTFDISGIAALSTTINLLSGSGTGLITLGNRELIVNTASATPTTFAGTIQGGGGSLSTQGDGSLTLSGTSSYTGSTIIQSGSTLIAGSTTALAPLSDFTVDGTLNLQTFSNTINNLFGDGSVMVSTPAILKISNGGSFSGGISGTGGLTLNAGTLALTTMVSANTYSGPTLVANNSTLSAGGTNALSPNSDMTITGTLLLNNFANTILSLSGAGTVNTGTIMNTGILTITNGGIFSGGITGLGGVNLTGGTLQLTTTSSANTYSGPTTISNSAILQAGATNAFSPFSDYTLNDSSTLDLHGFSNTISSLSSASASSTVNLGNLAILTINGGKMTTFDGEIINAPCGGLTIDGGTNLTLTNSSNTYCGPTSILNGTLQITNGALSPFTDVTISSLGTLDLLGPTPNSANSVTNSGTLYTQEALSLATTYTQTASGILDLQFEPSEFGQILATTGISLNGTLEVTAGGSFPTTGLYTLLSTSSNVVSGVFSTFTPIGFGLSNPLLEYSLQSVDLFFSTCNDSWIHSGNGNWGDGANWGGGCVPGANGNQNDIANFPTVGASAVTVTLADALGAPESFTLLQLNLNSTTTQYTINQLSSATTITFDSNSGPTPQINVLAGTHIINAPLILNKNSDLTLTDSTQLTFNPNTTLTSASTQSFTIRQSNVSTTGSGLLINNATLTPYTMNIISATVQNNAVIAPLSSLTIAGFMSGQTATVTNSGAAAQIGPSLAGSSLLIGGAGTTIVTNSGASAIFGSSASGANLTINGSGPTTVTNMGLGVKMGSFGPGGNVTVTSGTVNNESGALFQAGSGGVLTINGGTINNDLTSTVGTNTANIVFTSGLLNTTGNVVAFNYTQSGSSNLELNLTSVPTIVGNVAASGTATIASGSTLTVNALPGSVTTLQTTDLITALKGVSGTYSTVNFLNFPAGIIPDIIYTPNAVELVAASTVTPTSIGSVGGIPSTSINEIDFMVLEELHDLHELIIRRKKKKKKRYDIVSNTLQEGQLIASADPEMQWDPMIAQNTGRQEHLLTERIIEEEPNPSRFYFGPIDNCGRYQRRSTVQQGFGYNSVGVFTGIDHAFENFGLGLAADYQSLSGKVNHHAGHFHLNQIHANAYATAVPPSLEYFAVDAIVGFGYDWYSIHRKAGTPQTGTTAKANTHGLLYNALLGAEYVFMNDQFQAMPQNVWVTPFLDLQYIGVQIDSFKEHDAGAYDLKVSTQHIHSLRSGLGTRFEYMVTCKNFTFKPEIDVAWQYEFMDHKRKVDFTTINMAQNHTVSKNIVGAGRNTLLFGVDFLFTIYKVFELELSYDLQWNSLYLNNAFYLGIGGNF